ncbi:MAG: L-serine ammonia-lyase, iron-sulfur-dependent subunit beta [Candidatus Hodarchaeales archaeon]
MSVFDFIGPIMVGPSSSHTAGALRLARVAMNLLGNVPEKASIIFPRKGSFTTSYRGHGSDKAIIGGLLGFYSDDPRIKVSSTIAKKKNLQVEFIVSDFPRRTHPNTIKFNLSWQDKKVDLTGISVGGGNILVTEVLGFPIEYNGIRDVITVYAEDYIDLYVNVLRELVKKQIAIYKSSISYIEKSDEFTTETNKSYINIELKTGSIPTEDVVNQIRSVPGVIGVRFIPKLKFAKDLIL